jgi:hypothetical protein
MPVASPSPRPAAPARRAAAFALAALAFLVAVLTATTDRSASAHVASIGALQLSAHSERLTRSAADAPSQGERDPRAHLGSDGPEETADLGSRSPTPTSAVRSRGDGSWVGPLPGFFGFAVAARCLAPAATAALLDGASGARIAALHERAFQTTPPREPNPARGPPRG